MSMRLITGFWTLVVAGIGVAYTLQPDGREQARSFTLQKQWGAHLDPAMPLRPWGIALLAAALLLALDITLHANTVSAAGCYVAALVVWVGAVGVTASAVAHEATWSGPPFYAALLYGLLHHGRALTPRR